jgi:hypothetical protein
MNGPIRRTRILFFTLAVLCSAIAGAQGRVLVGRIVDGHSGEPVPFASVQIKKAGTGKLADSAGAFRLRIPEDPVDTLEITSVGFQDLKMPLYNFYFQHDTLQLTFSLVPGKFTAEVVVRKKVNRGLIMWRRIVARKPFNDRYRFQNFSYELYNKLELDINNVTSDKLAKTPFLKSFDYVINKVDTAEGRSFLPTYLTEAISHYYFQKNPLRRREVFKAVKTLGVKNESVNKLLGGMDQVVNFYNNFIPVFDKQFVSPISDNGDEYYNYKVADTQYAGGRRLIHFLFVPKRAGTNTFEGDCWVHDTTFAIQKMNLRLGKDANVNYVNRLSLIQEYQLINDSTWFLSKDKFVVDINPIGKERLAFIGRKTTTYRQVVVNDPSVLAELEKNKKLEERIVPSDINDRTEEYWSTARHEELSKTEKAIYTMVDTLLNDKKFIRYTKWANFIGTGYMRVGKFLIGPWQNWMTRNIQEGYRVRFDLGTNSDLSKKFIVHGYVAYGFDDRRWKGEADFMYLFGKKPRAFLYAEYVNDFDRGQQYYDQVSTDNIFAFAVRKTNVPIKFLFQRGQKLQLFREFHPGFSLLLEGNRRQYTPVRNLPGKELFLTNRGEALNTFEASLRFRFAYLEQFIENTFYRSSLGSPYPVLEMKFTQGIPGVLNSSYRYSKLSTSISTSKKIPPLGNIYVNAFGGKTWGTVPYLFLDVAPGNEIYYYNKYAFNMMNRFEFIHDRYAGLNVEHNIGSGIFRFTKLTRKMGLRQFWTAKALWGSISEANRTLNYNSNYPFHSLNGKTYMEVSTGVSNILKIFRVDFVWRILPRAEPGPVDRFGVFGSFKFGF